MRLGAIALVAALLAGACATGPAISDPAMIFAAADWTDDVDAVVKTAGWGGRSNEIKAHMNETGGGWPASLSDADTRWMQGQRLKDYKVREIARLRFHDQDAVLLHVPAAENQHLGEGWKPARDFFILISAEGFSG